MSYPQQYGQQPYGQQPPPGSGQPGGQQPGHASPSQYGQQVFSPQHSGGGGGGIFTDFKFSPLEWGAVAAWVVGFILILVSYFASWASVEDEGANLGDFMDVPESFDSSVDSLSLFFIVVSILALLAGVAAIVLRGTFRLVGRIVAGALALLTLLFVILLMSEISSSLFEDFKNLPEGAVDYGFSAGAYFGIFGAVLLGAAAALAHRSGSATPSQAGYGQPYQGGQEGYGGGYPQQGQR